MTDQKKPVREVRPIAADFRTDDKAGPIIEGYFAVFNTNYEIAPGMTESIAPGAFHNSLANDIRALVNHDSTLVLGRTRAKTLSIFEDEHGLYGQILINTEDRDAMNLYERVKRGDVSQCSFGFEIVRERSEVAPDGSVHWTIEEVNLFEVSACTFPAYAETNIEARSAERVLLQKRSLEIWKDGLKRRLRRQI